jgi:microcystin-dependent protein
MNKIDLFKYPRFPLSAETLDFLQQLAVMMSKAAGIGGDNFILSGCIETGSNVSAGVINIAGEVMPFIGGTKETYIVIEETKRSVTAEGQVFQDIYITRQARFGTGPGQADWSLFKAISISDLEQKIATIIPTGVVVMWSGTDAPTGWHLCDGADGTPDLRGRFVVGQLANDVEFAVKGNTGGQKKVSLSIAQMPQHNHSYNDQTYDNHASGSSGYAKPGTLNTINTGSKGNGDAHENLPPYFVLAYIIKL